MALRHTALQVEDVEGSVEFYEDRLGYEVLRSFEADDGTRNVFVGSPDPTLDDDSVVQLVEAEGPVETGDFEHVAVTVDDVDATVETLDDERITGGPTTMDEFDLRVAFVEAPEGWGIELVEEL